MVLPQASDEQVIDAGTLLETTILDIREMPLEYQHRGYRGV
jgi:hypothetical protein